jgi:ribosome biogenesis GTPase / thiamine phosphate phosphatase
LKGQVTVLAGLSGVGKSTLLTAVQPDFDLRIGAISEDTNQGKHTTTQTNMLPFGDDGYVIDTPGIREFGLAGVHRHELINFYPELLAAANECRFSDCSHRHEPDCAVRVDVESGIINATRYDSYIKIRECLSE